MQEVIWIVSMGGNLFAVNSADKAYELLFNYITDTFTEDVLPKMEEELINSFSSSPEFFGTENCFAEAREILT